MKTIKNLNKITTKKRYSNKVTEDCNLCRYNEETNKNKYLKNRCSIRAANTRKYKIEAINGCHVLKNFTSLVPGNYMYAISAKLPRKLVISDLNGIQFEHPLYNCADIQDAIDDDPENVLGNGIEIQPFHHPCLINNKDAIAAGEIQINSDNKIYISNRSGHYLPDKSSVVYPYKILKKFGYKNITVQTV